MGCKDLDTGSTVRGTSGGDGTHGMLLQSPRARIQELDGSDMRRKLAVAALLPPSGLVLVPTGKDGSPRPAEEVGDEHDERSRDGDGCWFELDKRMVSLSLG